MGRHQILIRVRVAAQGTLTVFHCLTVWVLDREVIVVMVIFNMLTKVEGLTEFGAAEMANKIKI